MRGIAMKLHRLMGRHVAALIAHCEREGYDGLSKSLTEKMKKEAPQPVEKAGTRLRLVYDQARQKSD
jgi:hypothetical protein